MVIAADFFDVSCPQCHALMEWKGSAIYRSWVCKPCQLSLSDTPMTTPIILELDGHRIGEMLAPYIEDSIKQQDDA